jgi:hypothetical protein
VKKRTIFALIHLLFSSIGLRAVALGLMIVLIATVSCNPVKRLEKMKARYCPYCVQPYDSVLTFIHDSVWLGDTVITVENPFIISDTVIQTKERIKVLYREHIKTVYKADQDTIRIPVYITETKYRTGGFIWGQVVGFWIFFIIFIAWFILQMKGGVGLVLSTIKNLFNKSKT